MGLYCMRACVCACGNGCGHHSSCSLRQHLLQAWSSLTMVSKLMASEPWGAISLWGWNPYRQLSWWVLGRNVGSGVCKALCWLHLHPVPEPYLFLPSSAFTWGASDLENMWFTETRNLLWEQAGLRRCLKTELKLPLVGAQASHQISNFPSWN